ncbi:MAG: DUF4145 domain-containing protein [Verrucomicrobiae bacterium]|nr:DUF4145 domain-containing protein [Verrucomicrobiae bacterium]
MAHFEFLQLEWPALHEAAAKAESLIYPDPRTSCFHARRALELLVAWLYKHDASLRLPYQDNLGALIHEPTFKTAVGDAVFAKARLIQRIGNEAVHSSKPVRQFDALKRSELELLIQRRTTRQPLAEAKVNEAIVERYYQTRAIRRIGEAFEEDHDRKALVVMTTGAGKTFSANQIEFLNLIVDHLTERGVVEPGSVYESPFTDLTPRGPDALFSPEHLDELVRTLEAIRLTAVAA